MVVCKKWPRYYKLKTAKSNTPAKISPEVTAQYGPIYSSFITETFACRPFLISTAEKTLSTFVDKESQQQMYAKLAAVDLTGTIARNAKSLHELDCLFTKLRTSLSD